MTNERLQEIEAIHAAAMAEAHGPWSVEEDWQYDEDDAAERLAWRFVVNRYSKPIVDDRDIILPACARFVASASADVPQLIARVRGLQREVAELKTEIAESRETPEDAIRAARLPDSYCLQVWSRRDPVVILLRRNVAGRIYPVAEIGVWQPHEETLRGYIRRLCAEAGVTVTFEPAVPEVRP